MSTSASAPARLASVLNPMTIALSLSLVLVSGVHLVYPALPVIAAELHVPETQIGLVIAAFTMPAIVLAPVFGLLADSHGRRPVLLFGTGAFAIGGVAAIFAGGFEWLLACRAVQGIGMSALSPLTIVLLSDLAKTRDAELEVQGFKVAIDRFAMIVLPLIGGALAVVSWRLALLPYALVFLVLGAAFVLMPETREPGPFNLGGYVRSIGAALRDRRITLAIAVGFFRFFGDYGFFIYLPLLLQLRYGYSVMVSGTMLSVTAFGAILTAVVVGRMSVLGSTERLLAIAFGLAAIGVLVLLVDKALPAVAVGYFIVGLANGMVSPLQKNLITRNTPRELRGGVISCDRLVQQFAKSLAPTVFGFMLVFWPLEAVFVSLAIMSCAAATMMVAADR